MRDQLDKLVQELLEKGVLYDDARREFEKMFIARRDARPAPQYHREEDYRVPDQTIELGNMSTRDSGLGTRTAESRIPDPGREASN